MPYDGFYNNLPPDLLPTGSRANAYTSSGQICFNSCNISFVHGTTPGTATINYDGTSNIVPADEVVIEIGNSTFFGYATALKQNTDFKKGRSYDLTCVDTRDRLLDLNHYAQYNMLDEEGNWYHLPAWVWRHQTRAYIDGVDASDIDSPPSVENQISLMEYQIAYLSDNVANSDKRVPPLLTAYQILDYIGVLYGFDLSATESAFEKLVSTVPENLNFNNGAKLSEVIQVILNGMNLQYYVHGDLIVEITEKGKPQGAFEHSLMAGLVDFCSLPGFRKGNVGAELNEKGRRVVINGGPNLCEYWYMARPDWNPFFDWNMVVNAGGKLSAFFAKHAVTRLNLMSDLPEEYRDGSVHPTDKDKTRNSMTIKDYLEQVCFKIFRVDFDYPGVLFTFENSDGFYKISDGAEYSRIRVINEWEAEAGKEWLGNAGPTVLELNEKLVSDSDRQSIVRKISRKIDGKGIRPKHLFLSGTRVYTDKGYSLKDHSVIGTALTNFTTEESLALGNSENAKKMEGVKTHSHRIIFSEVQVDAAEEGEGGELVFFPAPVHIKLALKAGRYQYVWGELGSSVRVRETIIEQPEIRRNWHYGVQQPLLVEKYRTAYPPINFAHKNAGFATVPSSNSTITPDQLSQRVALAKLNHEAITTAGTIEMEFSAGFMPSGIIQSVRVDYNNSLSGPTLKEVIRFTNELSDPDLKDILGGKRKLELLFEEDLLTKAQKDKANEARARLMAEGFLNIFAPRGGGDNNEGSKDDLGGLTPDQIQNAFNKNNSVMVQFEASDIIQDGDIEEGEILILDAAVGTDVAPY